MRTLTAVGLVGLFLSFMGCASLTREKISEADYPLPTIQSFIEKSLPIGKRQMSSNGREFFSDYFVIEDGRIKPAKEVPARYYAHITILGETRPYTIEVEILKERRHKDSSFGVYYSPDGQDRRLAKGLRKAIQERLSKRRDDHNVIDDFRVF